MRMDKLRVGDVVHVRGDVFSPVYMFSHWDSTVRSTFVQLTLSSGKLLHISPTHYLYSNGVLKPAYQVAYGDMLMSSLSSTGDMSSDVVIRIKEVELDGLYNPHTLDGDIAVDGITTSTFTTAVAPHVAHGLLTPVRLLYRLGLPTRAFNMPKGDSGWLSTLPRLAPILSPRREDHSTKI